MTTNMNKIIDRLEIDCSGKYENHFYVVNLKDSDEYSKMYTRLSKNAINTEFPSFRKNTNNSTTKITNYFEIEEKGIKYNIFLIADFDKDLYYIKIGEA